ncbi:MAG: ATPase, partial [Pseudomonadota bacterium]
LLAEHTLIVYIKTSPELEQTLIERAREDPKPLYYRDDFLDESLAEYMAVKGYGSTNEIPPDDFVSWVFPKLFRSRLPRYQAIADQYGYTVDARDVEAVGGENDFIELIATASAEQQT